MAEYIEELYESESEIDVENDPEIKLDEDEETDEESVEEQIFEEIGEPLEVSDEYSIIDMIPDCEKITSEYLTKSEATHVIAVMAEHISKYGTIFIETTSDDPIMIAKDHLKKRKCWLKIRRFISKNKCEEWDVNQMVLPDI